MAIAAMILGIATLLMAIVGGAMTTISLGAAVVLLLISLIGSIVGIVISAKTMKKYPEKKGMGITGLTTSIIAVVYTVICLTACVACASALGTATSNTTQSSSSENSTTTSNKTNNSTEQTLNVGDTWTVDGQWKLTIDSVTTTQERNQFSEKNPQQVVVVTYSYENLGYENKIMDGLYFDLAPNGEATITDSTGEVAFLYPAGVDKYPQKTPVGAKCTGAQSCIGLMNQSDTILMTIKKRDGNGKSQTIKYNLKID